MEIKLSDYIALFLSQQGIKHVFAISGGASLHLIHSLEDTPGIMFVCPQHEQAAAMAADGYSRATGGLGAAMATSGPGATNLITGICSAFYDSIPVLFVTGQVSTFRLKRDTGVRQIGFQETDVVEMCRPITKYSVLLENPLRIRYELEKACYLAKTGRPGPVLLDIPDNIQREYIDQNSLEPFIPEKDKQDYEGLRRKIEECVELIKHATRPVIILGWGVRLAGAEEEVENVINTLGFPVVPTWAVADILPCDHRSLVGTFGTHGTRYANFAVQNADLILAIGSRLDTKATGSPVTTFGREAKKVVVDIDRNELNKFKEFGLDVDLSVNADAKVFLQMLNRGVKGIIKKDISSWMDKIAEWKTKYPIGPSEVNEEGNVDPYVFVKSLSKEVAEEQVIFVDTGCTLAWMMQAFEFKANQRLFHDWNNTAMGWALPASIGACFALDKNPIICVTGDGSLQMNIQELVTVIHHRLPIKIFLINNKSYSMIQQTQDQWLDSKYLASTVEGGLAFPDFVKVAEGYGFKTVTITRNKSVYEAIRMVLECEGPVFCNVEIGLGQRVMPQVKFGRPNEDSEPLLDRKEFFDCMIIKPDQSSLQHEE